MMRNLLGLCLLLAISSANAEDADFDYNVKQFVENRLIENKSSLDLANSAVKSYSNFRCAVWSEFIVKPELQKEFLTNGYWHGLAYVKGLLEKKIQYEDKYKIIPSIMFPDLKMTPDTSFMVGSLYQKVYDSERSQTYDFEDRKATNKYIKKAKQSYVDKNCAMLLNPQNE